MSHSTVSGLLKMTAWVLLAIGASLATDPAYADRNDPRVKLVEPERGERRFTAPATIPIEARAEASRGRTIIKVEFFANGQPIGEVATAPYEIAWTNVPEGRHRLRARATDSRGARDWSQTVLVRVHENQEPRVRLVSPHPHARFAAPATIELEARARDRDHNLSRVEFYANGVLLGSDNRPPFRFTWTSVSAGAYVLTAKAIDALGATDVSRAVPIEVTGNLAPTVILTSPANNAEFSAPATVALSADANDLDGTISRVDFLLNGALVGSVAAPPFSLTVSNVSSGTYTIAAVAVDNLGAETTSDPVNVTVTPAPQAQLYFIHTDHLNTPRLITNSMGQAVWQWNNDDPFGNNAPNENPSGLGNFTCNLRLPGQYFDKETNTYYNYFRDYDPAIGRFVQSDPLGLRGGINTYAYVGGNPLSFVDLLGLLSPNWHLILTGNAAIAEGVTPAEARVLARATAEVDFEPGSQNPENAYMHAMTPPRMGSSEAQSRFFQYIDDELKKCTMNGLARAIHAAQDFYTGGHRNLPDYPGFLSALYPNHFVPYFFPSRNTQIAATVAARNLIKRFREMCRNICR